MDTLGWKIGDRFKVVDPEFRKVCEGKRYTVIAFNFTRNHKGELCLEYEEGMSFHHSFCEKIEESYNQIEPQVF